MLSLQNWLLYATTLVVVAYCLGVLYHVQTAWDAGLRGLFAVESVAGLGIEESRQHRLVGRSGGRRRHRLPGATK